MREKLRAAVIGLGVGERHIAGWESHPDCEVTALCDIDKAKLAEVGARHPGKKLLSDPDAVFSDPEIDAVSVATYDNCHFGQVTAALKAGKHVFAEKPLCVSGEEARGIRRVLNEHPSLKLSGNLVLRASPRFARIHDMTHAGEFGEITYMDGSYNFGRLHKIIDGWRGRADNYSVTLGGGIHIVDLMLWITGKKVRDVFARGNKIASRGTSFRYNDLCAALLTFEDGAIARLTTNFGCVQPHFHEFTVFGTKATFVNAPGDALLYKSREKDVPPEPVKEAYRESDKGVLIRSFVNEILGEGKAVVSADEVFDALSVCLAIEESMKSGAPYKVAYI